MAPAPRRWTLPRSRAVSACLVLCALFSFALGALTDAEWIALALGAAVIAGTAAKLVLYRAEDLLPAQLVVTAGFLVSYDRHRFGPGTDPMLTVAAVMIMALLLNQMLFRKVLSRAGMLVSHLPGARIRGEPFLSTRTVAIMNTALVALIGYSAAARARTWPLAVLTVAVAGVFAAVVADGVSRRGRLPRQPEQVGRALRAYQPEFIVYFSAPANSDFQIMMWLPYLERIGRPFLILVREQHSFKKIAAAARVPVVFCPSAAVLEEMITESVRVCFYVNNGMKNSHLVRFNHLTHVQLLHGDSDKPPSFNPVTAMFDRIFVAGQAGIDRYTANGVTIPAEKFTIVGRPQVEQIEVGEVAIRDIAEPTVVYTPTWVGYFTDTNHCSLPIGDKIITALLERGVRVIMRPHPYCARHPDSARQIARIEQLLARDHAATGRDHVYGARASTLMTIVNCVNAADAMISDVSSVASDFLYSGKPLAFTDMLAGGPAFAAEFPLARAAYVLAPDGENLPELLDDLLGADPLAPTRRAMKEYYLGDFPPDRYGQAFVEAARALLRDAPVTQATAGRMMAVR